MIDFTPIAVSVVGGVLSIIGTVFLAWLQAHMKDQAAKDTIRAAVLNSLGAVKQAADAGLATHPLQLVIPGISPSTAAGVQYVLNNAAPELARFADITPETIAEKVEAKIGLAKLADAAVSASPLQATRAVGIPLPLIPPMPAR